MGTRIALHAREDRCDSGVACRASVAGRAKPEDIEEPVRCYADPPSCGRCGRNLQSAVSNRSGRGIGRDGRGHREVGCILDATRLSPTAPESLNPESELLLLRPAPSVGRHHGFCTGGRLGDRCALLPLDPGPLLRSPQPPPVAPHHQPSGNTGAASTPTCWPRFHFSCVDLRD